MERKFISLGTILCGVAVLSVVVDARTITVGLDGNSEYSNISAAVDAAGPDDTILLADGFYTGPGNRGVTINKPLTIRGIGGPEQCIIDCEGVTRAFTVVLNDPMTQVVFEGITVTGGVSNVEDPNGPIEKGNGGGILFSGQGTAVLKYCIIRDNQVFGKDPVWGGGICCLGEWDIRTERCRIENNQLHAGDGYFEGFCTACPGGMAQGGGLYVQAGNLTIEHCAFIGNKCTGGDAVGWCPDDECPCWPDAYVAGDGSGAAFGTRDAVIDVRDCLIVGNIGKSGEGNIGGFTSLILFNRGIFSNCTMMDNKTNTLENWNWPWTISNRIPYLTGVLSICHTVGSRAIPCLPIRGIGRETHIFPATITFVRRSADGTRWPEHGSRIRKPVPVSTPAIPMIRAGPTNSGRTAGGSTSGPTAEHPRPACRPMRSALRPP